MSVPTSPPGPLTGRPWILGVFGLRQPLSECTAVGYHLGGPMSKLTLNGVEVKASWSEPVPGAFQVAFSVPDDPPGTRYNVEVLRADGVRSNDYLLTVQQPGGPQEPPR